MSKDGSRCSMMRTRTKLARIRLSPRPIPWRNDAAGVGILPVKQLPRLPSFTHSLIAAWWLNGPSNGASDGADGANALEESGLSWRDAETQAFVEVWNQLRHQPSESPADTLPAASTARN